MFSQLACLVVFSSVVFSAACIYLVMFSSAASGVCLELSECFSSVSASVVDDSVLASLLVCF